ncbi:MAG: hypothetical protein ACUVUE_07560 [Candidatus Bathycorpusculaceae bacterium]
MLSLTQRIKDYAKSRGATLVGIAAAERLSEAPEGHRPKDFLPDVKNVVSIGLEINRTSILQLPKTIREYKISYDTANLKLNSLALEIASLLEREGYEAVPIPASAPYDAKKLSGDISHKHVAVAAGLGKFGLSNLVLTPKYGPFIRFVSVITNAPLEADEPLDNDICIGEECSKCVKTCPVGALTNPILDPINGWRMKKEACHRYIQAGSVGEICGLCIKACPASKPIM